MDKKIITQASIVFNEKYEVKAYERDNTILLMELLEEKFPGLDFGDKKTGFMNVPNVVSVLKLLKGEFSNATQKQYHMVFNKNNHIKNCGRDNCIKLMEMLMEEFPGHSFGDLKTGFIDLEKFSLIK